jgi:Protein of unknown function (DUF669).
MPITYTVPIEDNEQTQKPRPTHVVEGNYEVTIVDAVETVSKSTGNDMIRLQLEVAEHGVILFDYLVAAPKSEWKINAFRRALGETVTPGETVEIDAAKLVGRKLPAKLRVEEYQGRTSNKIDAWLPAKQKQRVAAPKPTTAADHDEDVPF